MTRIDKIKEYMVLCGIRTNNEIKEKGEYPRSVQYLGQLLNGLKPMSKEEEKSIYASINKARAKRIMKNEE